MLEQQVNNMDNRAKTSIAPKAKRVVSFFPRARARRTTHVYDYTKEEIRACWYSRKELLKIREENGRIVVDMMKRKDVVDGEQSSRRGLEWRTNKKEGESTYRNRRKVLDAVLYEQLLQSQENNRSEEMLASVYQQHAYKYEASAYVKALADEVIARGLESPLYVKSSMEKIELESRLGHTRKDQAPVSKQSVLPSAA
jgi:hypothetical protein